MAQHLGMYNLYQGGLAVANFLEKLQAYKMAQYLGTYNLYQGD